VLPSEIIKMAADIGKKAFWQVEGLKVPVEVLDIRKVWNRVDYLCKPFYGNGEKWISEERIALIKDVIDHAKEMLP
jgi:hypothetical protein